eukprot:gnl/TRDRNA2_/TRDRNA2_132625_c4_seq1.p1 gnl/TRDRNA2_/TRDRNA2_132625_c4~~gnl/TRDRNA2_/TRDRNA2_132625_c4_seq1.p1  ORF type:complete len:233 (-),score=32.67 gnl/TRDRNA2_/TRDRNA2_132625_c4_seq1:113-811(-)
MDKSAGDTKKEPAAKAQPPVQAPLTKSGIWAETASAAAAKIAAAGPAARRNTAAATSSGSGAVAVRAVRPTSLTNRDAPKSAAPAPTKAGSSTLRRAGEVQTSPQHVGGESRSPVPAYASAAAALVPPARAAGPANSPKAAGVTEQRPGRRQARSSTATEGHNNSTGSTTASTRTVARRQTDGKASRALSAEPGLSSGTGVSHRHSSRSRKGSEQAEASESQRCASVSRANK